MNDLISRQAAIAETWKEPSYSDPLNVLTEIRERIKAIPPAQQEQPAEWVPSTKYKGFLTCSACEDCYIEGWSDKERKWRYCPQCGKRIK